MDRTVQLWMNSETVAALDELADRREVSRSALIRQAVREFLDRQGR